MRQETSTFKRRLDIEVIITPKCQPMSHIGPIIIVEDDTDDQEIISHVLNQLNIPNEVVFFDSCQDAYNYLKTTTNKPFIILSDINLPGLNGLELKRQIDSDPELRQKSIPFIFMSTAAEKSVVNEAYTKMAVHGFFQKTSTLEQIREVLSCIINYWKLSKHPAG